MNDNLLTSEVLDLAADAIQSRGWTRQAGWNGQHELFPDSAPTPALCLEGGIMAAAGITMQSRSSDGLYWSEALSACPAHRAVCEYLNATPFIWNDAPERTEAEVIEVLRAAAAVERAKEAVYSDEDTPLPVEVAA